MTLQRVIVLFISLFRMDSNESMVFYSIQNGDVLECRVSHYYNDKITREPTMKQ